MYFLIIMAFAFVLSEGLPPDVCNLFPRDSALGPVIVNLAFLLAVVALSWIARRRVLKRLDGSEAGIERAIDEMALWQQALIGLLAVGLVFSVIFTPWIPLIRENFILRSIPLLPDLVILAPLFTSLGCIWTMFYAIEMRIRGLPCRDGRIGTYPPEPPAAGPSDSPPTDPINPSGHPDVVSGTRPWAPSFRAYLIDKLRHQVLVIAAPMCLIVLAKYFTDRSRADLARLSGLPWAADLLLGAISVAVLVFSPVLLRYIWVTRPLAPGPLRQRFERTCRRIGLRYREILVWDTHGLDLSRPFGTSSSPMPSSPRCATRKSRPYSVTKRGTCGTGTCTTSGFSPSSRSTCPADSLNRSAAPVS